MFIVLGKENIRAMRAVGDFQKNGRALCEKNKRLIS